MRKAMGETYSHAGILKRAGRGLVLDIAGAEFFLLEEDLRELMSNRMADIVNHRGDMQGLSWLSPLIAPKKNDMTSLIDRHIYVVDYRGFDRVVSGDRQYTVIKEYRPYGPVMS